MIDSVIRHREFTGPTPHSVAIVSIQFKNNRVPYINFVLYPYIANVFHICVLAKVTKIGPYLVPIADTFFKNFQIWFRIFLTC